MSVSSQRTLVDLAVKAHNLKLHFEGDGEKIVWFDVTQEKFYRYQLNAFEVLKSSYQIFDWIEQNIDEHAESWDPYVISRRVVNWIKFLEKNKEGETIAVVSIFWQLKRLAVDIEYHLQANHLFENFKALHIGAAYLLRHKVQEKEASAWLRMSTKGLQRELKEQILPDGAHYERSPMYHTIVMEGVQDIKESIEKKISPLKVKGGEEGLWQLRHQCEELLPKMEQWLSHFTHPDGQIALFQDSAFDGVPTTISSRIKPTRMNVSSLLEPSGYFVHRWGNGNYFVIDCGEPSPRYQPGHAHCSILSYELSLAGKRVIVDTGCGSYQNEIVRQYCRSAAAHNVPHIAGCEQSEIWGAFRMGRRAKILFRTYDAFRQEFRCRVQDYRGTIFLRSVKFTDSALLIEDRIEERKSKGQLQSLVHLAPSAPSHFVRSHGDQRVESGSYFPVFGRQIANTVIHFYGDSHDVIRYSILYGT